MQIETLIGAAAGLCSAGSFAPQVWKIAKTGDARAISRRMYVVTVTGFSLWIAYGLLQRQWPLVLSNAVCLALSGAILAMKLSARLRDMASRLAR